MTEEQLLQQLKDKGAECTSGYSDGRTAAHGEEVAFAFTRARLVVSVGSRIYPLKGGVRDQRNAEHRLPEAFPACAAVVCCGHPSANANAAVFCGRDIHPDTIAVARRISTPITPLDPPPYARWEATSTRGEKLVDRAPARREPVEYATPARPELAGSWTPAWRERAESGTPTPLTRPRHRLGRQLAASPRRSPCAAAHAQ